MTDLQQLRELAQKAQALSVENHAGCCLSGRISGWHTFAASAARAASAASAASADWAASAAKEIERHTIAILDILCDGIPMPEVTP